MMKVPKSVTKGLKISFFFMLLLAMSCSTSKTDERPSDWKGQWNARWETLPSSYPGIEDMEFYMNGSFTFTEDSLTIQANGFEKCIFNSDTLRHTQSWYVSSDTLFLVNEPGTSGMTYKVQSKTDDEIKLQLMEDIFVTLTK